MNDVCFSGASLAILGAIGAALGSAITLLFRELIKAKNEAIDLAWRSTDVAEESVTAAREVAQRHALRGQR